MERTKMPNLQNGCKVGFEPGTTGLSVALWLHSRERTANVAFLYVTRQCLTCLYSAMMAVLRVPSSSA